MVKKGSVQNKPPNELHMGINCYTRWGTTDDGRRTATHFKSFLLPDVVKSTSLAARQKFASNLSESAEPKALKR